MSGSVKFTTNERVDQITDGQQYIEIIGYVEEIGLLEYVGYDSVLKKFSINNGTGRQVPCTVWDNLINKFTSDLRINKIVHLRFLRAKKRHEKHTKIGNVDIELICGPKSTIKILDDYVAPKSELDVNTSKDETDSRSTVADQQQAENEDVEASNNDSMMGLEENKTVMKIQGRSDLFDEYMISFFKSCNKPGSGIGTCWIVKLTKSTSGHRDLIISGKNDPDTGRHVEDIFTMWWRGADVKWDFTSVEVYTNNTPCRDCACKLKTWLKQNQNVNFTIYFAFVYTYEKHGRIPDADFVGGLQELRNLPNRNVRLRKINEDVMKSLGIQFKGYPWYDNYLLEKQIITD